jgi:hypothetical protein
MTFNTAGNWRTHFEHCHCQLAAPFVQEGSHLLRQHRSSPD